MPIRELTSQYTWIGSYDTEKKFRETPPLPGEQIIVCRGAESTPITARQSCNGHRLRHPLIFVVPSNCMRGMWDRL